MFTKQFKIVIGSFIALFFITTSALQQIHLRQEVKQLEEKVTVLTKKSKIMKVIVTPTATPSATPSAKRYVAPNTSYVLPHATISVTPAK